MQVKKFEARTMKEALEMVKRELGPDAIILSARDHRRSFGLVGEVSVEITAAVSPDTLHKKKFAESRMKPEVREKFLNSPARLQRRIMDEFIERHRAEEKMPVASAKVLKAPTWEAPPTLARPTTSQRYVDIDSTELPAATSRQASSHAFAPPGRQTSSLAGSSRSVEPETAESRIKQAALRAWDAMRGAVSVSSEASRPTRSAVPVATESVEISALRDELQQLKKVLTDFQKVPQSFLTPHPGAAHGISYEFSASFEKLTQAGIDEAMVVEILEAAQAALPKAKHQSKGLIDGWTAKYILDTTQVTGEKENARLQLFIGPRGTGKTSSVVKMASHEVVSGNSRVALLTADTQKVGAVEQMKTFAQILNVPFGVIRKPADWSPMLDRLCDAELIYCDFPGLSLKSADELMNFRSLLPSAEAAWAAELPRVCETHLVLSACSKDGETSELCRRYQISAFDNLIFNHLDEALNHGIIYNTMKRFNRPLHSFGVGPRVPEDFEFATKERVLDLIFKLSKLRKGQENL
ncbi:MAG: flagellar biosynthesis protein FlhF [Bdellovibrio sp.]|nr:MAG: flagellar biosynthesis protein FlhF [Bdellovibrio sp.]